MGNESEQVEIALSGPGQKPRSTPHDREYIIQSCYELLSSGLPLTAVLEEAKRLSNLAEINHPSAPCQPDVLQASEVVRIEKSRRIHLPRLAVFTSFWLVAAMCSMAMIATAVIAVVTHLPAAAEAISPINVPSDASQAAAATSLEPVVVLAEVSPHATPAASGQERFANESFANAPTPTSNLFEDFAREHPVEVAHNHGLTRSAASRRVLQGRVHGRLDGNDRYARPALPHTGRRDSYKPPYDRVVSDYFRHPQSTGFYGSSHPKSAWPRPVPHRVRVGDGLFEYDGLIGHYVPLAGATPR